MLKNRIITLPWLRPPERLGQRVRWPRQGPQRPPRQTRLLRPRRPRQDLT
jgi:hypothetical protein